MKLEDLSHESQLDLISQAVESYFEKRLNVAKLTDSAASKMLESVQHTIATVRKSSNIHTSEQNPEYLKAIMLEQALLARLSENSVGTVGTISPTTATTSGSIATTPPPKTVDIQRRAQQMKDPKMKDMLNKAAKGQNMSNDEIKRLAAFAADSQVEEDIEGPEMPNGVASAAKYSKDFGPILSKLSKVIDSVKTHDQLDSANNYAELVISRIRRELKKRKGSLGDNEVYGYMTAIDDALAEKERSISRFSESKQFNEEQSVYKIKHNKEDDLYDIVDELGEVVSSHGDRAEAQAELRKLKNKGSSSTRKVSGSYGKVDENKLRGAPTAKLVEFYRNHRNTNHAAVKMVEAELLRRKGIFESAGKKTFKVTINYTDKDGKSTASKTVTVKSVTDKNHAKKVALDKHVKGLQNPKVARAVEVTTESQRSGRKLVTEGEVQQAQVVLAAQDMVDQIQKMIEQASNTQFKDLPALVSQIRLDQGPDQSSQFNQAATSALSALLQALQTAKDQLLGAVDVATGNAPAGPVINPGDDAAAVEPDAEPGAAADAEADLDLDSETSDITGFGRERR